MTRDARFEDGAEKPLLLRAVDAQDLTVISALIQDAVLSATGMTYQPAKRRFGLLVNRFRWEDRDNARRQKREFERVQSLLVFEDVQKAAYTGIDPRDKTAVLSILSLSFEETQAPSGRLSINFAGDGTLALTVECLDALLKDVTRPYVAPSHSEPAHRIEDD